MRAEGPKFTFHLFNGVRIAGTRALVEQIFTRLASGTDLLRVMISKSLNFIFSVTVRPRAPLTESFATASRKTTQLRKNPGLDTKPLGERTART